MQDFFDEQTMWLSRAKIPSPPLFCNTSKILWQSEAYMATFEYSYFISCIRTNKSLEVSYITWYEYVLRGKRKYTGNAVLTFL